MWCRDYGEFTAKNINEAVDVAIARMQNTDPVDGSRWKFIRDYKRNDTINIYKDGCIQYSTKVIPKT